MSYLPSADPSRNSPKFSASASVSSTLGNAVRKARSQSIQQQTGHAIRPICQVLGVPRSSYYHAPEPTPCQSADVIIGLAIQSIFKRHRRSHSDLADQGVICATAQVRRIIEERGLRAIQPKIYVPKTSKGKADKPSPNLLLGKPIPEQPNKV